MKHLLNTMRPSLHVHPKMRTRIAVWCLLFAGTGSATIRLDAQAAASPAKAQASTPASALASARYVPHRVFDSRRKQWIDFETLVQRANSMDLVFVGENHDDTPGHAMELALLEGIARRRANDGGPVILSLEMFERDAQGSLDAYLHGTIDEATFLAKSRPWPNYALDYKPLVELAKKESWPVIASNVPRPIANIVSRGGLSALDTLPRDVRAQQVAATLSCPDDKYGKLFKSWFGGEMNAAGHGVPVAGPNISADSAKKLAVNAAATEQRYYEAQCVKDETMGESVATALRDANSAKAGTAAALVVHMNGSFHTNYKLGTADRATRRAKDARSMVISIVPTANLDKADGKAERSKGDYIIFTIGTPE